MACVNKLQYEISFIDFVKLEEHIEMMSALETAMSKDHEREMEKLNRKG